ncbi:MAG TPA: DinB family protein [Terriglobales bacterium]|nr:DinB family protein [Terriglobales bacterium]
MTDPTAFHLYEAIAVLSRTPAALDALLRGLSDTWVRRNEGDDSWSAYDIVGHLANLERTDWMVRLRRILEEGDSRAFDRVDRFSQMKGGQNQPLEQRLDEFARLRGENLAELRALNLQPDDLERRGLHPALGPVTLGNLLATWAGHDLTHLHQLSRVMAYQYRDAVGPWAKFLGVMQCHGHSAAA